MKRSVQEKRAKREAGAFRFARERQLLRAKRKAAAPCRAPGSCSGEEKMLRRREGSCSSEEKRAKRKEAAPAPCPDRCFQAFFLNMLRNQEFSSAHWSRWRELRPPQRGTALPASSCAVACLPCRHRTPFSRSAGAARHATRSAAQAAALAKCNRQRCPRLSSLRRVPFPCAVLVTQRFGCRGPSNPQRFG